jgi:hypothetical protein
VRTHKTVCLDTAWWAAHPTQQSCTTRAHSQHESKVALTFRSTSNLLPLAAPVGHARRTSCLATHSSFKWRHVRVCTPEVGPNNRQMKWIGSKHTLFPQPRMVLALARTSGRSRYPSISKDSEQTTRKVRMPTRPLPPSPAPVSCVGGGSICVLTSRC